MKRLIEWINNQSLLTKIFIVMFLSIATISITISFSVVKMTKSLFIETFSITNSKVITEIKSKIEEFNYSVVIASNNISRSKTIKAFLTEEFDNPKEMMVLYYKMNDQMEHIRSYVDNYDIGIMVGNDEGESYSTNRIYWPIPTERLSEHPITKQRKESKGKLIYDIDQLMLADGTYSPPAIIISKALIDEGTLDTYGVMYFSLEEKTFRQFYNNYTSTGNHVIVMDGLGKILSSSMHQMIDKLEPGLLEYVNDIKEAGLNYQDIHYLEHDQILIAEYLPSLDLYLINLIDQDLAMADHLDMKKILFISIPIALIALLLVFIISRRLTKSLTNLVKEISHAPKEEFKSYATVAGNYETKQLATTFNQMLDELHDYVNELLITQKQQRRAELDALQHQINPHFLYNTLASINIMVQQKNEGKATEMIHALIALLQNALQNVGETISVAEELINTDHYVFINQARYGDRIKVNQYISPACLSYQLPKLIIQPFIENAFFHGFNKKTSGFINIMIREENKHLICEIIDNGDGMKVNGQYPQVEGQGRRHLFQGIGIKNVNDRINLLYGDDFGVDISSKLGEGTQIKITLPVIE